LGFDDSLYRRSSLRSSEASAPSVPSRRESLSTGFSSQGVIDVLRGVSDMRAWLLISPANQRLARDWIGNLPRDLAMELTLILDQVRDELTYGE